MNREDVETMISSAEAIRQYYIDRINLIISAVLEEYEKHPNVYMFPQEGFDEDEKNSIDTIRSKHSDAEWYKSHDAVWTIFVELRSCAARKRLKTISDAELKELELKIDPDRSGDIRIIYEKRYLDTKWITYDGDLILCNPFDFIKLSEFSMCPSLLAKNTLDNKSNLYTVTDINGQILGSITTDSKCICAVLAKDLWAIPSANEAVRKRSTSDYTFIKQFHGRIKAMITNDNGKFSTQLIGEGSISFKTNTTQN